MSNLAFHPETSSPQQTLPPQARTGLLRPGHNCWRVEEATRLQFLIDGENYFSALRSALQRARHSIFIIGWDIDSRVALPRNGADDTLPESLAQFLDALARARRDLDIYVLSWDYALLFTLEREWLPALPLQWRTHRRVHFRLDSRHPIGASHHQKLVVIDDEVAFVGGIDITRCRWDTCAHEPDSPRRVDADGNAYAPFHDVQALVAGPVAAALGELARTRWERACTRSKTRKPKKHEQPKAAPARNSLTAAQDTVQTWPPEVTPALENIRIAIARTESNFETYPECLEIRNFYLDAINAARRTIFFENQYFSSNAVALALNYRLKESDGPDVVVIAPHRESGWLEENTMGLLRARLYEQLKACAQLHRFHTYSPMLTDGSGLNVHSKLMIVDDEWLTIGSANISNRSMSLDTECNLILEAGSQGERAAEVREVIAQLRRRLLAEHLDSAVATVAQLEQRTGTVATIETLRATSPHEKRRTLAPSEPLPIADNILVSDTMLVDPEKPLKPEHVIENYIAQPDRKPVLSHTARIGGVVLFFAALILLWRETQLRELLNMNTMLHFVEGVQRQPLAPLIILALYVVAGFAFVPVVLLIAATGIVFGPWLGLVYATAGSMLSAAAMFWIGSKTGDGLWRRMMRGRARRLQSRLQERGFLAVAMVRAMPVAPFTVVNLIAGAARLRWRDYLLGTLTGMLPGIVLTVVFVDRASAALRQPSLGSVATLVLTMGFIVAVSLVLQHWLGHRSGNDAAHSATDGQRETRGRERAEHSA